MFFQRLAAFIKNLFRFGADTEYRQISRFAHFMEGVERDDAEWEPGHAAVLLCDESLSLVRSRVRLAAELRAAQERLAELECFLRLTDEDAKSLKDLFVRYRSLTRDHAELKRRVVGFSEAVAKVAELEGRPNVLRDIQDAEGAQKAFKGDVAILRGEKTSLDDEYERMGAALELTRRFAIGFVAAMSLAAVTLAFLFVFSGAWVLLPAGIAAVAAIVLTTLMFMLRRHLQAEMRRNVALRQRAVGMLNRKSAVYAHYTSFLKTQYKKYSIRNSEMLKRNLREYANYKHLTKRLDSVRSIMRQTEDELTRLLRELHIPNSRPSMEQFIEAVDVDDQKAAAKAAEGNVGRLEALLAEVEDKQEKAWLELDQLAAVSGLAARIIMAYMAAAERVMTKGEAERTEDKDGQGIREELQPEH